MSVAHPVHLSQVSGQTEIPNGVDCLAGFEVYEHQVRPLPVSPQGAAVIPLTEIDQEKRSYPGPQLDKEVLTERARSTALYSTDGARKVLSGPRFQLECSHRSRHSPMEAVWFPYKMVLPWFSRSHVPARVATPTTAPKSTRPTAIRSSSARGSGWPPTQPLRQGQEPPEEAPFTRRWDHRIPLKDPVPRILRRCDRTPPS